LGTISGIKPEKVWWRKLDFEMGDKLTLEGFSVGEAEAASYYDELSKLQYFDKVELAQIARYEPPNESPIPSKYFGNLFRFKLEISGIN
jgi:hypothetical protein